RGRHARAGRGAPRRTRRAAHRPYRARRAGAAVAFAQQQSRDRLPAPANRLPDGKRRQSPWKLSRPELPLMRSNAATFRAPAGPAARPRGWISARAVGTYVPKLTHKAFEKYGFAAAALITDWATIVGKDVAAYTEPERLKWPRGVGIRDDVEEGTEGRPGATLIVRVEP